jgi:trk system potassium uptake protein TrkA
MNVIVVGCGRVGSDLAYRLFHRGYHVIVIDRIALAFNNLPADFRGRTLEGDVLSEAMLHRAGIGNADALAAVTSSDSLNGVIGHVAATVYGVPTVVVRNYDPRHRPLVEIFGLQVVSSSTWGAQRIEELLIPGAVNPLLSAGNGEIEISELAVSQSWAGRTVHDLAATGPAIVAALTRAGRGTLPEPGTVLQAGDTVHVSASPEGLSALRQAMS